MKDSEAEEARPLNQHCRSSAAENLPDCDVYYGQVFWCSATEIRSLFAIAAGSALAQLGEGLKNDLVPKPHFTHLKTNIRKRKIT